MQIAVHRVHEVNITHHQVQDTKWLELDIVSVDPLTHDKIVLFVSGLGIVVNTDQPDPASDAAADPTTPDTTPDE